MTEMVQKKILLTSNKIMKSKNLNAWISIHIFQHNIWLINIDICSTSRQV